MVQIVETEHPVVETNVETTQVTYETLYGTMEAVFITIGSVPLDNGVDGPGVTPPPSPDIIPVRLDEEVRPVDTAPSSPDIIPIALEPANPKLWYAVTMGKNVGVFQGWSLTSPNVTKVSGACFTKCATKELAEAVFDRARAAKAVFYLF
ncbi:hypothetical protein BD410DRAFT_846230 [Rickenella mellea]|uniref:Ribonuclease H1 N-terminal domain-containing protein n=1 Tax=Rickenella mellea TaxID=50990 RepID=A0A4Y7PI48_9AGAM|nr:hypothetical protein BD410DRAFT_846230 [Rickenella mellea]